MTCDLPKPHRGRTMRWMIKNEMGQYYCVDGEWRASVLGAACYTKRQDAETRMRMEDAMKTGCKAARIVRRRYSERTLLKMEVEEYRSRCNTAYHVLSSVSSYLGNGLGDEYTTAEEYQRRILDGVEHWVAQANRLRDDNRRLSLQLKKLLEDMATRWSQGAAMIPPEEKP